MNVEDVKKRVAEIRKLAETDFETAHFKEDALFFELLVAIRDRQYEGRTADLANEALKSSEIRFTRACA